MEKNYCTESGYHFSLEDVIDFVKFKVPELINNGLTINEIIQYDDSQSWKNEVNRYLRKVNKNQSNTNKTEMPNKQY